MKRRLFLQSSVSSALAAPAIARASEHHHNTVAARRIYFDERFAEASALASRLAGHYADLNALTPVNGDVTAPWVKELGRASARGPLSLRGVTTESFYFCLKTLLQTRGLSVARIERVDRDLHAWEIRTKIIQQDGMA